MHITEDKENSKVLYHIYDFRNSFLYRYMVYSYPYIDPERFRYRNKKNISFGCSNYVE